MADEKGIIRYKATDGSEVKLSPQIVANYIVTGNAQADPKDVFAFMAKCQARGLNPLAGDAYMTTYRNNKTGEVTSSVIVSKDYFVRTAAQQPDFDGIEAGVVVATKAGLEYRPGALVGKQTERLVGGWAKVHVRGRSHPSEAVVSLDEYDTGRSLWRTKPATMIRKVALVQALREAYPAAFSGVYDAGEMPEPVSPVVPSPTPAQPVAPEPVEAEAYEAEQAAYAGEEQAYQEDVARAEAIEADLYDEEVDF